MIKISHSVFALPFALGAAALAFRSENAISGWSITWIVIAAVAARTLAMAQNRLVDARIDKVNPRTADRAIPAGRVTRKFVRTMVMGFAVLFVASAGMLNPLCMKLSPVIVLVMLGYPYTKRFTWLCHLWLGVALGLAPIGAWVAVRGSFDGATTPILFGLAVVLWTAGFDCIYACQDAEHDRSVGLSSIPARWGTAGALKAARVAHGLCVGILIAAGYSSPTLGWIYFLGVAAAAVVLTYENSIVKADDLSRINVAFFTLNGLVSLLLGGAIVLNAVYPSS
jgi:4-hydroxybenzoate polyprenyltransferase